MMRTTIITRKAKTTLTIQTSEDLYLEQMGVADQRIKLTRGVNSVPVDAGVFSMLSTAGVSVTADAPDVQVTTTGDKDGTIDPLVGKDRAAPQ
jgi:hypothetical protein